MSGRAFAGLPAVQGFAVQSLRLPGCKEEDKKGINGAAAVFLFLLKQGGIQSTDECVAQQPF